MNDPASKLRLRFDAFELDEPDARLKRDGAPLSLPPRAFAVLCALARQPGQLVTKDALLDAVWGHRHVSESVLKTTISELRAVLGDDPRQPRYIETASRRGYRFVGMVTPPPSAVGAAKHPEAVPSPQFIGREQALEQLHEAWGRAQGGERQLVWVTGEAGVGKTRLIDSFINSLPPGTATFGQCVEEFGTGEPYLPILEAMRELCRRDPALVTAMRGVAPTWLVQMPWLVSEADRASLYSDVGGAHQDRMVREMRELMDRFTANRPLIFVLEDLHWSDAGTLRMMEHFARRPREVRLMWIASFRLTQVIAENHPLRELRQELRLHKLCREISLDPFSETEVASYLCSRAPQTAFPDAFIKRLHAHTDGLPLFVANVADNLLAQAEADPDAWRVLTSSGAPLPLPDNLAGVIEKQATRLPEETQRLLEAAGVLGLEFRASYLAKMLSRDIDWVCDECDRLVRRQFWIRLAGIDELADGSIDPRYAFLHALYKHVFYQRISLPQRVQMHRRAGLHLEEMRAAGTPVTAAELASHAERGHQFVPALRYYGEAADLAVAHFAPTDALALTDAGLKLLGRVADGANRAELELGIIHRRGVAAAQLMGIGAPEAVAAFERTLALCDSLPATPARALLLSGLGLSRYVLGDYPASQALATRVLEIGEDHDDDILRVSATLLLGMIQAAKGEHRAAVESLGRGIVTCARIREVPRGVFVIDPLVALHSNISIPLMALGLCDRARGHLDAAHARARAMGQPIAQMLALWTDGMVNVRAEDHSKVMDCANALTRVVDASMLTQGAGPASWLKGWATSHLGNPREGHRLIREGFEIHAKLGMFAGNTETLGYAAKSLVLARDWEAAERQLVEAIALADRIGERGTYAYLLRVRGEVAATREGPAAARAYFDEALAVARAQQSLLDELKVLNYVCRQGLATDSERAALQRSHDAFPEGHGLPFMKNVAATLAQSRPFPDRTLTTS